MDKFCLVKFTKQRGSPLFVVPKSWTKLGKDGQELCVWPPNKNTREIAHLAEIGTIPGESWKTHEIKIIYQSRKYSYVSFYIVFY